MSVSIIHTVDEANAANPAHISREQIEAAMPEFRKCALFLPRQIMHFVLRDAHDSFFPTTLAKPDVVDIGSGNGYDDDAVYIATPFLWHDDSRKADRKSISESVDDLYWIIFRHIKGNPLVSSIHFFKGQIESIRDLVENENLWDAALISLTTEIFEEGATEYGIDDHYRSPDQLGRLYVKSKVRLGTVHVFGGERTDLVLDPSSSVFQFISSRLVWINYRAQPFREDTAVPDDLLPLAKEKMSEYLETITALSRRLAR